MSNVGTLISMLSLLIASGGVALFFSMRQRETSETENNTSKIDSIVNNSNKGEDFKKYVDLLKNEKITYMGWKR